MWEGGPDGDVARALSLYKGHHHDLENVHRRMLLALTTCQVVATSCALLAAGSVVSATCGGFTPTLGRTALLACLINPGLTIGCVALGGLLALCAATAYCAAASVPNSPFPLPG